MDLNEIGQFEPEPEEGLSPRNHRLRRGVYLLPSFLTLANLLCGFFAVLATFKGTVVDMDNAAKAIGFAILFDALDGRIARATGTNTAFGKEFDSLADVVSFGIAPALLAFAWGARSMLALEAPQAKLVYQFGWLVSFIFVICCAWRLARFNVHGMAEGSRYFVGMPTPAAAGMVAATVHAFWQPIEDWRWALLWLAFVLLLAVLMSSTMRYYSFKDINWRRRLPSRLVLIGFAVVVGVAFFYSEIMLLLIAGAYVLQGLTLQLVRVVRHRLAARPA